MSTRAAWLVFALLLACASSTLGGRLPHRGRVAPLSMSSATEPAMRIGHGFDIHRLVEGAKLVIGGVTIPHAKGAEAHSDGDAMVRMRMSATLLTNRSTHLLPHRPYD